MSTTNAADGDLPEDVIARLSERHLFRTNDRLSLDTTSRVRFATFSAAVVGAALGFSHGAQMSGYQFRAENSHRLPITEKGWYFYHKTKNYVVFLGGIKEGGRMALKLGLWTGLFFLTEGAVDRHRGQRDVGSSVCAAMAVAGTFSLWNRLPFTTAARMTRLGLYAGLGYGFAQDTLAVLQGQKVSYVEWFRNRTRHR